MAFKFDSHSCYIQTRALTERHQTFDAVPAHHELIEQPGDSACQTMDKILAAFGVEEEKLCISLQQEVIRNHGFDEDIKLSSAPRLWPFNISLKSTLCILKLALSSRFVGSAGQVSSFPVRLGSLTRHACRIDVRQNSEMLTEQLVAPYGTFCMFTHTLSSVGQLLLHQPTMDLVPAFSIL